MSPRFSTIDLAITILIRPPQRACNCVDDSVSSNLEPSPLLRQQTRTLNSQG